MNARASLAAAAVLSLAALVVRADRRTDGGLLGSLFPQTQAYETVDYNPPRLPPLSPPQEVLTPAQETVELAAPVPAAPEIAPAYLEASAFPAVPELANAREDELVALNTSSPLPPPKPGFEPPELAKIDVLDSDAQTAEQKAVRKLSIASFEGAPCGDACSRAPVVPRQTPERFELSIPNPDLHWRKLPCSQPGAFRYELVNDGDKPYHRLVVFNGGQRWDVGTLDSRQTTVLSSATPFGRRTIVDHEAHFDSPWSRRR